MSNIQVNDLVDSLDLDREAMTAIAGGARVPRAYSVRSSIGDSRIFSYPGSVHQAPNVARGPAPRA